MLGLPSNAISQLPVTSYLQKPEFRHLSLRQVMDIALSTFAPTPQLHACDSSGQD